RRAAGGVRRFERGSVDVDAAVAAAIGEIHHGVGIDLPVETPGPARFTAVSLAHAGAVRKILRRDTFAGAGAHVAGSTAAAAGFDIIPALAIAGVELEALDGPVGQIDADLSEQCLVGVLDMRRSEAG